MNELALFAGAGGGILGGQLLGWRTVCAVEWEPYAACVLAARQNDGLLPNFPIWDDVQTFRGEPWRGIVDVISGGFPCTDISAAGKGAGIDSVKNYFKTTGLSKYLTKEFRIIGENPQGEGETIVFPKTASGTDNPTDGTVNTSASVGSFGEQVSCSDNIEATAGPNSGKVLNDGSEIYSVAAMACRRVAIGSIKVTVPPPKKEEPPKQQKSNITKVNLIFFFYTLIRSK